MHLKNITIKTARLEELKKFYSSQLALPVQEVEKSVAAIQIGESLLRIEETNTGQPFYHFAINIPANKIEKAREWLEEKKIELLWMEDYKGEIADFVSWHAKSVYFFDPAGNIVELIARFDLNNSSPEQFSSRQFLCISEIGLVFPEDQIDEQVNQILIENAGVTQVLRLD